MLNICLTLVQYMFNKTCITYIFNMCFKHMKNTHVKHMGILSYV